MRKEEKEKKEEEKCSLKASASGDDSPKMRRGILVCNIFLQYISLNGEKSCSFVNKNQESRL